ncbi:hypothetical protein QUB40_28820 [Microcoleus sp. AT9_A2]|uniref:hypothetical protein n=1 Tax=Microcoleus sp. AT9_A2 TaxID=2818624 RepID=UPI002FD2177E
MKFACQLQYVRLWVPEKLLLVRSGVKLAGAELLSIEPLGIGGSDTLRDYRQSILDFRF